MIHKTKILATIDLGQAGWDAMCGCSCKVLSAFLSLTPLITNILKRYSCDKIRGNCSLGTCPLGNNHGKRQHLWCLAKKKPNKQCGVLNYLHTN